MMTAFWPLDRQRRSVIRFGLVARVEQQLIRVREAGVWRDAGANGRHAERIHAAALRVRAGPAPRACRRPAVRPPHSVGASLRRDVLPEPLEAVVAAEQRREDRRIGEQDVAGPIAFRRHPEEHVELTVTGFRERMRPRHIDRLLREQVNGRRIVGGDGVVRQMRMEVEGLHAFEPAAGIEVVCA